MITNIPFDASPARMIPYWDSVFQFSFLPTGKSVMHPGQPRSGQIRPQHETTRLMEWTAFFVSVNTYIHANYGAN